MKKCIRAALLGNPNSGKTSVFNALTTQHQKVGNWPGVTVECKTGHFFFLKNKIEMVDLPGLYNLNVYANQAQDQQITSRYLWDNKPDVIINVLDGSNLERNLYVTLQLLELNIPLVIAVNMLDIAEKKHIHIDLQRLSQSLNCPVVGIVANKNKGISLLKKAIYKQGYKKHLSQMKVPWPEDILTALDTIRQTIITPRSENNALRLLEGDQFVLRELQFNHDQLQTQKQQIECVMQEEPDIIIADLRYRCIQRIVATVQQKKPIISDTKFTKNLDRILLNRYLGIPIFLCIMYAMFFFAINMGGIFRDFFDLGSDALFVQGIAKILFHMHAPLWLITLLANGVGKGINTVVTFIPILACMYLFLSFLEDSGYMARAAFVMDYFMQKLGLPGKAFVPMLIGFGCNVPAVMGARTLENPTDRILTVLMMPFMSCSARLTIFAVFASVFFPYGGQNLIFLLYLVGIIAGLLTCCLVKKKYLAGDLSPMVIELPEYHAPQIKTLFMQTWLRLKSFLWRAGKIIVPVCFLLGILNTVPIKNAVNQKESLLSYVGQKISFLLEPMGIERNNWQASVGLFTGVIAKEVVIGTLNTLYSGNPLVETDTQFSIGKGLKAAALSIPQNFSGLSQAFKNPLAAAMPASDLNPVATKVMSQKFQSKISVFSYLLFVLLYFPCVSTFAVIKKEIGAQWAYFSMLWSLVLAYTLSVSVYQLFSFVDHPWMASFWISVMGLMVFGFFKIKLFHFEVENVT